jgi:hypothetical protein
MSTSLALGSVETHHGGILDAGCGRWPVESCLHPGSAETAPAPSCRPEINTEWNRAADLRHVQLIFMMPATLKITEKARKYHFFPQPIHIYACETIPLVLFPSFRLERLCSSVFLSSA